MVRVCKTGGHILLLERGCSYISLYNEWLKFKAARDLCEYGTVEHLDIDGFVKSHFLESGEVEKVHAERKNLGMTYIYILRKIEKEEKNENDDLE
jgi:hypothetical protein